MLNEEVLWLDCKLGIVEKADYGHEVGGLQLNVVMKEEALKEIKARYASEIASYKSRIGVLSRALDSGQESRQVMCRIERDWEKGIKRWIRTDTEEVARETPIPEDETQGELDV